MKAKDSLLSAWRHPQMMLLLYAVLMCAKQSERASISWWWDDGTRKLVSPEHRKRTEWWDSKQSEAFLCVWETEISTLRYFWTEGSSSKRQQKQKKRIERKTKQQHDWFRVLINFTMARSIARPFRETTEKLEFIDLISKHFSDFYYCLIKAQSKRAKALRRSSPWISSAEERRGKLRSLARSPVRLPDISPSALNNFNHVWLLSFLFLYHFHVTTSHMGKKAFRTSRQQPKNFFRFASEQTQSLTLGNLQSFNMQHWRGLSLIP